MHLENGQNITLGNVHFCTTSLCSFQKKHIIANASYIMFSPHEVFYKFYLAKGNYLNSLPDALPKLQLYIILILLFGVLIVLALIQGCSDEKHSVDKFIFLAAAAAVRKK